MLSFRGVRDARNLKRPARSIPIGRLPRRPAARPVGRPPDRITFKRLIINLNPPTKKPLLN